MKIKILLGLLFLATYSVFAQGYIHFQTYAQHSSYHHKNETKVLISMGKDADNRLVEYDLITRDIIYLNDSAPVFRSMVANNNNGVGISLTGQLYYTTDNWKTINPSSQTGISTLYKTSDGFMGLKEVDRFNGEFYHSTDGNTWTKSITVAAGSSSNLSYRIVSIKAGKIWLMGDPRKFYVSSDGGNTFETKEPSGAPASFFYGFTAFDTLNAIGSANNNTIYRTSNGGVTWTPLAKTQIRLIYTKRMDSIIAYHPVDQLLLSTDSGTTWTKVNYAMPPGFTSVASEWTSVGNYINFQGTGGFYYSTGLNNPWKLVQTLVKTNRTVAAKANVMIVGGEDGSYAYSRNNGHTFIPGEAPISGEDLFASEVINDTLALMADRTSNIFVSKDGGASWQQKYSNSFNYIGIKFRYSADLSKIILRRAGQLMFSKNGGSSWEILGSVGGSFDATVTPSGKILMVVWYADTMRISEMSTTGNRTDIKLLNENLTPMGIEMVDDNTGYCFGINTTTSQIHVYKTTTGWNSFTLQGKLAVPAGSPLFHMPGGADTLFINFRNTSNADASLNYIYQTFDGGKTWSTNTIAPITDPNYKKKLQSIHFFNPREYVSLWDDNKIFFNRSAKDTSSNPNTFLKEINGKLDVSVYPNPANSAITIESPQKITAVDLYDVTGKLMLHNNTIDNVINVSELPAGIYYMKIFNGNNSTVRKIIKQ